MSWVDALSTVIEVIAVPYGYTVSIWAAGALAIHRYGIPGVTEILLFVTGAVVGYLLFDLQVFGTVARSPTFVAKVPSIALLNILPLLPAVLGTLLVREIRWRALGFFTAAFAATILYILSLASLIWGFSG